jgi:hypothetical protein
LESELLEGLINRVDKHIRIIKLLSPSFFTLVNLYDELAVMSIIRALPHYFDNVICTISVLDKYDKQSVIQSLRNIDQMHNNLSGSSTAYFVLSASQKASQRQPQATATFPSLSSSIYIAPKSLAAKLSLTIKLTFVISKRRGAGSAEWHNESKVVGGTHSSRYTCASFDTCTRP